MKHSTSVIVFHLLALTVLSGCAIIGDDAAAVANQCSSNSDCAGGVCVDVGGRATCVTKRADLPGLILEVQPSTEAPYGAGTSFLVPFGNGGLAAESASGIVVDEDIVLPHSVISPIELYIDYDYKGCPLPTTRKLPADFFFYRNAPHDGLPDHQGQAVNLVDKTDTYDDADTYTVDLPQGSYDMQVVPHVPDGCGNAPPPPTFHRDLDVSQGGKLDLHLTAPPHVISGTVGFPKGQDLTGWTIQVAEPKRGKPISPAQVLEVEQFNLYASYNLEYFWNGPADSSPVLRLRPKEGVDAPRFFWEIAAISPLNPNAQNIEANLTLVDLDAEGRKVDAFVVDKHGAPVVSTITFRSVELSGNASNNSNFTIIVDTDHGGRFVTKLPPGRYQVVARPTFDTTKAVTTDDWIINTTDDCICGKGLIIQDKSTITGMVSLPNGLPLIAGAATVYPSRSPGRPYLSSHLVVEGPTSQIGSAALGPSGDFSLQADPGLVDLLVVPPSNSFFPWLVRSQLDVQPNIDGAEMFNLPSLVLSYPAIVGGTVYSPDKALVTNSTVRAWMPVTAAGFETTVVIQMGETLTGSDGHFILPLAPSLVQ